MRASRRLMPTAEGLLEEFECWVQGHGLRGALEESLDRHIGMDELRKSRERIRLSLERNYGREDVRRRMHIAQWTTAQRHFALQEAQRAYRRQHAFAASHIPMKDDKDPDIAGQATAGSLFAKAQKDQNGAEDAGYKWKTKRWYASVTM